VSAVSFSKEEVQFIRRHTLRAISSNRAPGMHFAGYFLRFTPKRYAIDGVEFTVEPGPHCANADGIVHRAALLFAADMTLAAANRVYLDPNVRTATLMIRVEFTGEPARGTLEASGRGNGFSPRTALPESVCAGRVVCGGKEVMRMSGAWVSPPAPKGVMPRGLPWEGGEDGADSAAWPLLKKSELEAPEKDCVRRVEKAMRQAQHGDLLAGLWDPQVTRVANGARGKLPVGMHVGNRVGHVQGGLLINAALVTAEAAVPEHPILTGASAWYISPGQGKAIRSRSTILQSGRNIAVVRTELFGAENRRVLEVVSNHAVAARAGA
jgi:acyl-coenzyme A thioesterase PaaI-like protein